MSCARELLRAALAQGRLDAFAHTTLGVDAGQQVYQVFVRTNNQVVYVDTFILPVQDLPAEVEAWFRQQFPGARIPPVVLYMS